MSTSEAVSTTSRRDAWFELLEIVPWVFAGHHTFEYPVSLDRGIKLFEHYMHRILGGTFHRAIPCVAVPEFTTAGQVHFHAMYSDLTRTGVVRHQLERSWRYGIAKVKMTEDALGALSYMLKYTERDSSQPILSRALRDQLRRNQSHRMLRVE